MKIEELKWRLAQFLGVAGIIEIAVDLINREKEFLEFLSSIQSSSHRTLEALGMGFALECVWREFELKINEEGRSLEEEVNSSVIDTLIDVTNGFFSHWRKGEERIGQEEQAKFLEAIEEVTKDL